jgi:hypothetical protein
MIGVAAVKGLAGSLAGKVSMGLNIILILAIGALLVTKNLTISELRRSIDHPKTGYKVQLAKAQSDLTICRGNVSTLQGGIDRQNAGIRALADAADANRKIGAEKLERLRLEHKPLEIKVRQITNDRPQSSDLCAEADRLIKGSVK